MKKKLIALLVGLLVASALSTTGAARAAQTTSSFKLDPLDAALFLRINAVRQSHGLRPLALSPALSAAADGHTKQMAQVGYFAHASFDHTLFSTRIAQSYPVAGFKVWSVGENLLYAGPTVDAAEAMDLWMHSPDHRANILDPVWREIGISARHSDAAPGIYAGHAVTIVTTDFGSRT